MSDTGQITTWHPPRAPRNTVSTSMIRLLLSAAREAGPGTSGIVTLSGLTEEVLADDRNRVNTLCANALWGHLVQFACPAHVGTGLADRATPGALGVWDHLFTAGTTVLEGLRDAITYVGTVADTDREHLDVHCDGDLIVLRHRSVDIDEDVAAAVGEFVVATVVQRMSEVAQRRIVPV